jgi:predicted nucleic acid-binding protein
MIEAKRPTRAILDTNVFVAAGFNPRSASARLIAQVRAGRLVLVWSEATRSETRSVLERIPRLRWEDAAPLFGPEGEHRGETDPSAVAFVVDPEDRKFAALSIASGATLVSADDHLLSHRDRLDVLSPGEFVRALETRAAGAGPNG